MRYTLGFKVILDANQKCKSSVSVCVAYCIFPNGFTSVISDWQCFILSERNDVLNLSLMKSRCFKAKYDHSDFKILICNVYDLSHCDSFLLPIILTI